MKYNKNKSRILFLTFINIVILLFIVIRLFYVQFINYTFWSKEARTIQQGAIKIQRSRGKIFDRNMKTLALSLQKYSLYISPSRIKRLDKIIMKLSNVIDEDPKKIQEKIFSKKTYVKRYLDDEVASEIRKLLRRNNDVKGIDLRKEYKRYYPKKRLASNIIGFTSLSGKGLEGLEYKYNNHLKSEDGKLFTIISPGGYEIPNKIAHKKEAKGGKHLVLTIDENIQNIVQQELERVVKSHEAKKGMAIVMNPRNGEVLGMANYPTYDPNEYRNYSSRDFKNRCIMDLFEPGSTLKPFVMAAAIEESKLNLNEKFFCDSKIEFKKHIMKCYSRHGFLDAKDCIRLSCNDVTAAIADRVGAKILHDYLIKFGFGRRTKIKLPGEAYQSIPTVYPEIWPPIDLAARSIGYSVGVTAIQLITALSAIVNDGVLMQPKIIKRVMSNEGNTINEFKSKVIDRIISSETSMILKDMMQSVVDSGTAKTAKIAGLTIGGKTGTAKKVKKGLYSEESYVLSFFGFLPVENPKYSILVLVDEPKYEDKRKLYGGSVAAPAFKKIVKRIYQLEENVPINNVKAEIRSSSKHIKINIPNFVGKTKDEIVDISQKLNLNVEIIGFSGLAKMQMPMFQKEKKIYPTSEKIVVYLENQKAKFSKVMPNFIGKSLKGASIILTESKIENFNISGSGVVHKQIPDPGTELSVTNEIFLELKSN